MSTTTTTNSATCGQRFNDGTQTHNQETLKNGLSDVSDGGDATSPPTTPEYRLRGVFCDGNGNPFIDAFVKDISDISDWIKDPERAKHIARYGKPPEAKERTSSTGWPNKPLKTSLCGIVLMSVSRRRSPQVLGKNGISRDL